MSESSVQQIDFSALDFGQPEAENDVHFIEDAFFESHAWAQLDKQPMPIIVGRKGSGKSALSKRVILICEKQGTPHISLVPADFKHVEIRQLLSNLISEETSWQYIYSKVWEGILLGRLVVWVEAAYKKANYFKVPDRHKALINEFIEKCPSYTNLISDTLQTIIIDYIKEVDREPTNIQLIELRQKIMPYPWEDLVNNLEDVLLSALRVDGKKLIFVIDGLDDYWDTSAPSVHFLAQLLKTLKSFSYKLGKSTKFIVSVRDNIFRTLVDTSSVEYDKIESSVIQLKWTSANLIDLVGIRIKAQTSVLSEKSNKDALLMLLPEEVDNVGMT